MEQQQIFIQVALHAWNMQVNRAGQFIALLSDEDFLKEIAPGKNRAIYVIGHLVAIHDAMNTILGLGERAHSELDEAFVKNPDKSGFDMQSVSMLKQLWNEVHENLNSRLKQVKPDDWFSRHASMSDEEFIKEPSRNKLSVLLNRTNHLAYHLGQLRLLK